MYIYINLRKIYNINVRNCVQFFTKQLAEANLDSENFSVIGLVDFQQSIKV